MRIRILSLLILLLVVSPGSYAGEFDGGTESPLKFGVGSRELSLGGAAVARCDAATAVFWNPARLATTEYISVTGFHTKLFESDVVYQYVGIALPTLDFGTFAIGVQRLGVDNIEQRTIDNIVVGDFSDSRLGLHLGYGRFWGEYQLGMTIGMEHHSLSDYSATSSPSLSLAMMRTFKAPVSYVQDIDMMFAAENIIGGANELTTESISQPTTVKAALSMNLFPALSELHQVELSSRLSKVEQLTAKAALGLEYTYDEMISLRTGINDNDWSAGIGIAYNWVKFDYAVVDRELGLLHLAALTTSFGGSVTERRQQRLDRREEEFRQKMTEQMRQRNLASAEEFLTIGNQAMQTELYAAAVQNFTRGLFIARSSHLDTTALSSSLNKAESMLKRQEALAYHDIYLDSAYFSFDNNDLFNARYYCGMALNNYPDSPSADSLLAIVNNRLTENREKESILSEQIRQIDSLLTYGSYTDAIARAQSLLEFDPENEAVSQLLKRAEFEHLRKSGESAFTTGDYDKTNQIIAAAERLYPNHHWTKTMRERINAATIVSIKPQPVTTAPKITITEATRKEAEALYRNGQYAFEQGALEKAIADWERVESLIPDYASVRDYLVDAYKYLGVEHYSNNELDKALAIWRRASNLLPDNKEIASYIKRTEAELAKIKELSYEP